MSSLSWKIKRLRAMSMPEIIWRISQRRLQISERKIFKTKQPIYDPHLYNITYAVNFSRLGINYENANYTTNTQIELLGDYSYQEYKMKWNAGFQTDQEWPSIYSYDIETNAHDVPGDIRTNWELNRHHQFILCAKSLFVTKEIAFLDELETIFNSWNEANPFLWGSQWISPMEVSIRLINWLYCAAFLDGCKTFFDNELSLRIENLITKLCTGTVNMAQWVYLHRSLYSSANNHAVVEMCALGIAGLVLNKNEWQNLAFKNLNRELFNQNNPDGVNKEQSLHYQAFVMEAYALYLHVRRISGLEFVSQWMDQLSNMCSYIQDCRVSEKVFIEFGDDDAGFILNLSSHMSCYPEYVLTFLGLELVDTKVRWSSCSPDFETIYWLYDSNKLYEYESLPLRQHQDITTYHDGGITLMHTIDDNIFIGIDHGPLGFGSLAAHGHADALSLQLYAYGQPIFIDSGTYLYNGNPSMRDYFRSTFAHNTITIDERSQSEMLGAFLWGKRAKSSIESYDDNNEQVKLTIVHDGYKPIQHHRCITLDKVTGLIEIKDTLCGISSNTKITLVFILDPNIRVTQLDKNNMLLETAYHKFIINILSDNPLLYEIEETIYSPSYGTLNNTNCIHINVNEKYYDNVSVITKLFEI